MKIRSTLRRNAAAIAVAATLSALGLGGVMAAQASDTTPTQSQVSDGDGEQNDATEVGQGAKSDGETNDDAADKGPDANPNEPGHQDANDTAESDGDGEQNDATEVEDGAKGDGETNDDASDIGPDANPNEPGHQDANDK